MLKNLLLKISIVIYVLLLVIFPSSAQENHDHAAIGLDPGYYLIVGAYSINKEEIAEQYAAEMISKGYKAKVDYFPRKNFYFVYIDYYTDFNESIKGLFSYRRNKELKDCWVYVMSQTEQIDRAQNQQLTSGLSDMFASRFSSSSDDSTRINSEESSQENLKNSKEDYVPLKTRHEDPKPRLSTPLFISFFDARTGTDTPGKVEIIDGTNRDQLMTTNANEIVEFKDPENGTGEIILRSNALGFKQLELGLNYYEPLEDEDRPYITNIGDTVIVNFELERYNKGETMPVPNILYHEGSVVFKQECRDDLNQLKEMMSTVPTLKIQVQCYALKEPPGSIKTLPSDANAFFDILNATRAINVSAKKYSQLRSELIKSYLVKNGIDPDRISTKGFGTGKKQMNSNLNQDSIIEIEFLSDFQ